MYKRRPAIRSQKRDEATGSPSRRPAVAEYRATAKTHKSAATIPPSCRTRRDHLLLPDSRPAQAQTAQATGQDQSTISTGCRRPFPASVDPSTKEGIPCFCRQRAPRCRSKVWTPEIKEISGAAGGVEG